MIRRRNFSVGASFGTEQTKIETQRLELARSRDERSQSVGHVLGNIPMVSVRANRDFARGVDLSSGLGWTGWLPRNAGGGVGRREIRGSDIPRSSPRCIRGLHAPERHHAGASRLLQQHAFSAHGPTNHQAAGGAFDSTRPCLLSVTREPQRHHAGRSVRWE